MRPAILLVVGQNHGAHVLDAVFGKEHGARCGKGRCLGAECASILASARNIGIGQTWSRRSGSTPTHEFDEIRIVGLRFERLELARR